MHQTIASRDIILRKPEPSEGQAIHQLIQACPPLDLNSVYSYHLLCKHFAHTCVVAEQGAQAKGFLSAYPRPDAPDTLFVWQMSVHTALRGGGIARMMLSSLLARPECRAIRYLEATVSPSNHASRAVFNSLANQQGLQLAESEFLSERAFGNSGHEAERLLRLGPFPGSNR
ncbi:MAG: diaminobutyrate acetyltransferase [Gammaproteobacteria bacterium]|nr:diaminobutyrate acetyltransferase [Gammaproteobacteria bacterium]MBU1653587.1 diaminobutyrate acetyltransferase [Gammaproteobacteria bacterium]MBU1960508.1 diaminobutyrate acetyltransferase [Gammaproteobacteria bacterium]